MGERVPYVSTPRGLSFVGFAMGKFKFSALMVEAIFR